MSSICLCVVEFFFGLSSRNISKWLFVKPKQDNAHDFFLFNKKNVEIKKNNNRSTQSQCQNGLKW